MKKKGLLLLGIRRIPLNSKLPMYHWLISVPKKMIPVQRSIKKFRVGIKKKPMQFSVVRLENNIGEDFPRIFIAADVPLVDCTSLHLEQYLLIFFEQSYCLRKGFPV